MLASLDQTVKLRQMLAAWCSSAACAASDSGGAGINITQSAVPIQCEHSWQHPLVNPAHEWTDLNCTLAVLVGGAAPQGCIV